MKQALGNPAAIAFLSTPQGQKALDKTSQVSGKALDLVFGLVKIGVVGVVGYIIYRKVTGAFSKVKEDKNYKPSNVSVVNARQRAENIFTAMYGIKNDFNKISQNLMGLNRNGFTRVYNEFGSRRGADFKKSTLTEWLQDQFNTIEIAKLKFITKNAF